MKLNKRIAAASAAALLGTLALGGAAHAADNGSGAANGSGSSYGRTIEAPAGTPHVAAEKIRPASKDNPYSQTVKAPAGTQHTGAGALAGK